MKILVLMTQFHQLNGAERLGVELAEALNQRDGFQADIASIYSGDSEEVREAERLLKARGISCFHYVGLNVHPRPWPFIKGILRLRRLLKTGQYDIVETSQITPTVIACWASLGLRTRHIAGIHDVHDRTRYNAGRHKIWRLSVRLGHVARFYAISEFARQQWVVYSRTRPEKTEVVSNGIPDACFEVSADRVLVREELAAPRDSRIALFVGRMLKRKGIDTILDALGPILHDQNLRLVFIGEWGYPAEGFFPGEDTLRETMERRIASEGWTDRVHFLGRRNDVSRIMAASDVLVHPARIEGFGLVLAEALATGLPVVASNVQGIPEVLAGTSSVLVAPDDSEAVRAAVLDVLSRPEAVAVEAERRGRARAEAFRAGNRIDALVALFERS